MYKRETKVSKEREKSGKTRNHEIQIWLPIVGNYMRARFEKTRTRERGVGVGGAGGILAMT